MKRVISAMLAAVIVLMMGASALAYDIYQKDSSGNGVKALQQKLIDLAYLGGKADGWYGDKTTNAVKRFQIVHGMDGTGIADDPMQQMLFSDEAKKSPKVLMSINELKKMMNEAGSLGIRYDLSGMEVGGNSAAIELNNYVVLNCDLLGDDVVRIDLVGTQNVTIPFTIMLMAIDKSIDKSTMYQALENMIEQKERVVGDKCIRYEADGDIQRLIITPLEEG